MKINAQISILATYDDKVMITIYDKDSGAQFLDLNLTREQFINATMNRLAHTDVSSADVHNLDRVGKIMEMKSFEFEIPSEIDEYMKKTHSPNATKMLSGYVKTVVPEGWVADGGFDSQNTFFKKDGKNYARTLIRRWVNKNEI